MLPLGGAGGPAVSVRRATDTAAEGQGPGRAHRWLRLGCWNCIQVTEKPVTLETLILRDFGRYLNLGLRA